MQAGSGFKIYLVENEDPLRNSSGGVMTYLINLSKFISSFTEKPYLLAAGPLVPGFSEDSLPFRILRTSSKQISNIRYLILLFKFWRKIPNKRSVIIHCQRADFLLPFILFRRKPTLICTMHGMRDFGFAFKKGKVLGWIYSRITAMGLRHADHVIVVDKNSRAVYTRKYPWLEKKISVIPIGIDLDLFKPMNKAGLRSAHGFSEADKIVVFVGRLEVEKNVDFLIRACSNLGNRLPGLKLILIGAGSKLDKLKQLVNEQKGCNVIFFGEVPYNKVRELINLSDVLALCSTYEGSPTVIKEALACNIPVVSTDAGDAKEVVSSFPGSIICERNLEDYAHALESVLTASSIPDYSKDIRRFSHLEVAWETYKTYETTLKEKSEKKSA